jgi:hypothetical protein
MPVQQTQEQQKERGFSLYSIEEARQKIEEKTLLQENSR